jgi:hypothetical protein
MCRAVYGAVLLLTTSTGSLSVQMPDGAGGVTDLAEISVVEAARHGLLLLAVVKLSRN